MIVVSASRCPSCPAESFSAGSPDRAACVLHAELVDSADDVEPRRSWFIPLGFSLWRWTLRCLRDPSWIAWGHVQHDVLAETVLSNSFLFLFEQYLKKRKMNLWVYLYGIYSAVCRIIIFSYLQQL